MRYKAVKGSELGHECCYDGTVVDTETKERNYVVCECDDLETAQWIAGALNKAELNDPQTSRRPDRRT